jgi:hypothetical protein
VNLLVFGLLGWTVALLSLVFLVPGTVNTPGCAHKVSITTECAAQMAANNQALFWLQTVPFLATAVLGYVLVAAVVIVRRRGYQGRSS